MIKEYRYDIAGVNYHAENFLESLGAENEEYFYSKKKIFDEIGTDEKIYKYDIATIPVTIVAEENEHDKNALRIECGGVLVGYVPKDKTAEVKELLYSGEKLNIKVYIFGGEYKLLTDADSFEDSEIIEGEEAYYGHFVLSVGEKEPEESTKPVPKSLKITLRVLSILLLVISIILVSVMPFMGVIFILVSIYLFYISFKLKSKK